MNQAIGMVNQFYTAFSQGDFKTMQECYHPDVEFTDEVFPLLKGKKANAMWHMLVASGKDVGLQVSYGDIKATGDIVECDWEAQYKFSLTGRDVHNKIHARFSFKDNLIIKHVDQFDFYRWTQMAFGLKGTLLGWTSFFRKKVQQNVDQRLQKFISSHLEYRA